MRIIGGILLFLGGCAAGSGLITWHRAALDGLKNELFKVKMGAECDRAWQEGYREGHNNPANEYEQFARVWEQHRGKVDLRGPKEPGRHGKPGGDSR